MLLVRKDGPPNPLDDLLARPERWRLARGDSRSVTGFILPQVQLFLPNRIEMETRFRARSSALTRPRHWRWPTAMPTWRPTTPPISSASGSQFPVEAGRLQMIWQSEPTPPAQVLVRSDVPPELQKKLHAFLVATGRAGARVPRPSARC